MPLRNRFGLLVRTIKRVSLHERGARLERDSQDSRVTYVGNNRVLLK